MWSKLNFTKILVKLLFYCYFDLYQRKIDYVWDSFYQNSYQYQNAKARFPCLWKNGDIDALHIFSSTKQLLTIRRHV